MERKFKILYPINIKYNWTMVLGFSPVETKIINYKIGDIINEKQYQELIGMGFNHNYDVLSSSTKEMMRDSLVDYVQEITPAEEILKKHFQTKDLEWNEGDNGYRKYDLSPVTKFTKEEYDYLKSLEEDNEN